MARAPYVMTGRIAADEVFAAVRSVSRDLTPCYDMGLKARPGLKGVIVLHLSIDSGGRVSAIRKEVDAIRERAMCRCVMERFRRAHFPRPRRGTATVSVPVYFSPTGF
jgi:hypothetical protein